MFFKRSHLLTKLSILCLAISISNLDRDAVAQTESPPPELERLSYFSGEWRCQQPAAPETPSGIFVWTVQRDLNNFWYLGNAKETRSPNDGEPINSREFLGYDVASEKLVRSVVVGNGNSFNLTATDWQDDTLIWEGTVIDKGVSTPLRQEIIRDSPNKFTATYFIPDDNGNWQPVVDENCDRIQAVK